MLTEGLAQVHAQARVPAPAPASLDEAGGGVLQLGGRWTADQAPSVEAAAARIAASGARADVTVDLGAVERLDTLGAWVLERTRAEVEAAGGRLAYARVRPEHRTLLGEVTMRGAAPPPPRRLSPPIALLDGLGRQTASAGRQFVVATAFLGEVVAACGRVALRPGSFRGTALVNQLQQMALNGAPIIVLISFLVGGIVAQQGIFQLQRFGAQTFVVNLIGLLILRELGVLLTAIMVAGRSGSAITAEIGSMRMREEVDALKVMGLDATEILIVPRILALMIGLPMLTLIGDLAALAGGGLTAMVYGGLNPRPVPRPPPGRGGRASRHGGSDQGAVHGADHRAHRHHRGLRRGGIGGIPRAPRHGLSREVHLHGHRPRWPLRGVLRRHRLLRPASSMPSTPSSRAQRSDPGRRHRGKRPASLDCFAALARTGGAVEEGR